MRDVTHTRLRALWRLSLLLPLLLPLLLAACSDGSGKASTITPHPSPTTTPLPPTAKGIYFVTYDETTVNGQQSATHQTIVALNPADGSVRWKAPGSTEANLLATDRVVYADDAQGMEALRASDGVQLWSHPGVINFLYRNGVVYAFTCSATSDSTCAISAFDGLTGATVWTSQTMPVGDITLAGSDILVSSGTYTLASAPTSASLSVLDTDTGKLLWRVAVSGRGFHVAGWHGSQLYLLQESGALPLTNQLQAVRLSDGSPLWETGNIQGYRKALATDTARIYVQTTNGAQALNETDGSVAWTYPASDVGAGESVLANGVIYMPLYSGTLVAVDTTTGKALSSAPFSYAPPASPIVASGLIYLDAVSADSSHTASFNALDTTAGFALRWKYPGSFDTPAVSGGALFTTNDAPTSAPSVYAFNATSGALLWKYAVGHMVAYSASDATIVVD